MVACLGTAAPAKACVAVPYSSAQAFSQAEVVFVGTAVSGAPAANAPVDNSFSFAWTFSVDRAYKGAVPKSIEVAGTPPNLSLSCGDHFEVGKTFTVYAGRSEGRLVPHIGSPAALGTIEPPGTRQATAGVIGAALRRICRSRRVARSVALDSHRLRKEMVNDPALRYFARNFQTVTFAPEIRRVVTLLRDDNAAIDAHLASLDRGSERPAGAFQLGSPTDLTDLALEVHLAAIGGPDCAGEPATPFPPPALRTRIGNAVARYETAAVRLSSRPAMMRRRADDLERDVHRLHAALRAVERTATTTTAKRRWKAETLRLGRPVARTLRSAIIPAKMGDAAAIEQIRAELDVLGPPFARLLTAGR